MNKVLGPVIALALVFFSSHIVAEEKITSLSFKSDQIFYEGVAGYIFSFWIQSPFI